MSDHKTEAIDAVRSPGAGLSLFGSKSRMRSPGAQFPCIGKRQVLKKDEATGIEALVWEDCPELLAFDVLSPNTEYHSQGCKAATYRFRNSQRALRAKVTAK